MELMLLQAEHSATLAVLPTSKPNGFKSSSRLPPFDTFEHILVCAFRSCFVLLSWLEYSAEFLIVSFGVTLNNVIELHLV